MSMQEVKVRGQGEGHSSKQILSQFECFLTVTPVWIQRWQQNDAQSSKWLRRGALLFFKVIHQISRSHGPKNWWFDPNWAFPDCYSSLNSQMATKWCTKLGVAWKRRFIIFLGHPSSFKVTGAEKSMIWLQFEHFRIMATPIWIHGCLWNDTHGF